PVLAAFEDKGLTLQTTSRYLTAEMNRATLEVKVRAGDTAVATLNSARNAAGAEVRFTPFDRILSTGTIQRSGFLFSGSGYGLHFRTPENYTIEPARGLAQARGARSIEVILSYGPSLKEVFEQHQIATGARELKGTALTPVSGGLPAGVTALPSSRLESW